MKNEDVIRHFLSPDATGFVSTANLNSDGKRLINYRTTIAEWAFVDGNLALLVNITKYSVTTTTKHQNMVRRLFHEQYSDVMLIEVMGMVYGIQDLYEQYLAEREMHRRLTAGRRIGGMAND